MLKVSVLITYLLLKVIITLKTGHYSREILIIKHSLNLKVTLATVNGTTMKSNIYNNIFIFCYRVSFLFVVIVLLVSCKTKNQTQDINAVKTTIIQTEKDFETAVKESGIQQAFYDFADTNAVIKREDDRLIKGKEQIKAYYQNPSYKQDSVTWKPDFVEVSNDGSMAYTYGKYVWKVLDTTGKVVEFNGVFHTVWKKQADGSWKYVWD